MAAITAIVLWLALTSLVAFVLAVSDKRRARRGASRVPERTLLLTALVGGSPGLLLGMLATRHKTKKRRFRLAFACILAAQIAIVWLVVRARP